MSARTQFWYRDIDDDERLDSMHIGGVILTLDAARKVVAVDVPHGWIGSQVLVDGRPAAS